MTNKNSLMGLARYPLGNTSTSKKMDEYLNGIRHFAVNAWKKNIIQ
jgi:hypothetical protein